MSPTRTIEPFAARMVMSSTAPSDDCAGCGYVTSTSLRPSGPVNCVARSPANAARIAVDAVPIDGVERARALAVELHVDLRCVFRTGRRHVDRAGRRGERRGDLRSVRFGVAVDARDDLVDGLRVAALDVGRRYGDDLRAARDQALRLRLQLRRPVRRRVAALVVEVDVDLADRRVADVARELAEVRAGHRRLRTQVGDAVDGALDREHAAPRRLERRAARIRHGQVDLAAVDGRDVLETDHAQGDQREREHERERGDDQHEPAVVQAPRENRRTYVSRRA